MDTQLSRTILLLLALVSGLKGSPQTLLQEDFESAFPPTGWTITTPPNDHADGWTYGPQPGLLSDVCVPQGSRAMVSQWATYYPNDTWAFTPGLALSAGTTYALSFQQCVQSPSSNKTESLRVTAGTQADVASQTLTLLDLPALTNTGPISRSVAFTPSTSGVYHFAFNCYSAANQRYLSIDHVEVRIDADASVPDGEEARERWLYFDPANGLIVLQSTEVHDPCLLRVMDAAGRTVMQRSLPAGALRAPLTLDLSSLRSGMYLVDLTGPDIRSTQRIVKE